MIIRNWDPKGRGFRRGGMVISLWERRRFVTVVMDSWHVFMQGLWCGCRACGYCGFGIRV